MVTEFNELIRSIHTNAGWAGWVPRRVAAPSARGSHGMQPLIALGVTLNVAAFGAALFLPLSALLPEPEGAAAEAADFWLRALLEGPLGAPLLLALFLLFVKRRQGALPAQLGFVRRDIWRDLARGAALGLVALAVPVLALMAAGMLRFAPAPAIPFAAALVALSVLFFIIQAGVEELLVRGWLLPELMARIGVWGAVLLSSSLFAGLHLANPGVSGIAVVNVALVGVVFALMVIAQGSLWGACGFHIMWNWAISVGLGIEVSGLRVPNALLSASLSGEAPDTLTGGAFGLEASAITTAVLLGLIVLLWLWARRNGRWAGAVRASQGLGQGGPDQAQRDHDQNATEQPAKDRV